MLPQVLQTVQLPLVLHQTSGIDPSSSIHYVLLSVDGLLARSMQMPDPPPRLNVQCTKTPAGKLKFEIFADVGGAPEVLYYLPWKPRKSEDLYPTTLGQATIITEPSATTGVKPFKRQRVCRTNANTQPLAFDPARWKDPVLPATPQNPADATTYHPCPCTGQGETTAGQQAFAR